MSLSAHQAQREHVLAVSRDFNSQPRLSEYIDTDFFFYRFCMKKKLVFFLQGNVFSRVQSSISCLFHFICDKIVICGCDKSFHFHFHFISKMYAEEKKFSMSQWHIIWFWNLQVALLSAILGNWQSIYIHILHVFGMFFDIICPKMNILFNWRKFSVQWYEYHMRKCYCAAWRRM